MCIFKGCHVNCGKHDMTDLILDTPLLTLALFSRATFHVWLIFTLLLWFNNHNSQLRQDLPAYWSLWCGRNNPYVISVKTFWGDLHCLLATLFQFLCHRASLPDRAIKGQTPAFVSWDKPLTDTLLVSVRMVLLNRSYRIIFSRTELVRHNLDLDIQLFSCRSNILCHLFVVGGSLGWCVWGFGLLHC